MKHISKIIGVIALIAIGILFVTGPASAQMMKKADNNNAMMMAKGKSLYQRLGGYDALAAVTDDFLGRLIGDQTFARFFPGLSTDSKQKLRTHVIELLCATTGGPCTYSGRDMKTSHKGLGITAAEWDIAVKHLLASLDKFSVQGKEREELIAIVAPLKEQIVEKS
jgi:hemoglobin